jgi:hypothetical protein
MKATLTVQMDNAAFWDMDTKPGHALSSGDELARILYATADRIKREGAPGGLFFPVRDVNGNTVGTFSIDSED